MAEPDQELDVWNENTALDELIGHRVSVRSNSGDSHCEDTGILEAFDYPWIRLRKGKDALLCFPVHNVRLVELVRRLKTKARRRPDELLLRPAALDAPDGDEESAGS